MTIDPHSSSTGFDRGLSTGHELADDIDSWRGTGPWMTGAAWLADVSPPTLHGAEPAPDEPLLLRVTGPVRWNSTDEPLIEASISGHAPLLCDGQFLVVEAAAAALRQLPIPGGRSEPAQTLAEALRGLFGTDGRIAHRPSGREAVVAAESLHPNPARQAAFRLGGLPGVRSLALPTPEPGSDLDRWTAVIQQQLEASTSDLGVVLIAPFAFDPHLHLLPVEAARILTGLAHSLGAVVVADLRRWAPARGGTSVVDFDADVALLDGDLTGGLADVGCLVGDLPDRVHPGSIRPSDAAAASEVLRQVRHDGLAAQARTVGHNAAVLLDPITVKPWVRSITALGSYVTVETDVAGPMIEWVNRMTRGGLRVEASSRGVTFVLPVDAPGELLVRVADIAAHAADLRPGPFPRS